MGASRTDDPGFLSSWRRSAGIFVLLEQAVILFLDVVLTNRQQKNMANSESSHHDLKKDFEEKHLKEQHTRRAVVEVKVTAQHVKHNVLVRLPVGCLEIADPLGHHVQLNAANLSLT